jgi:hypothetical protein
LAAGLTDPEVGPAAAIAINQVCEVCHMQLREFIVPMLDLYQRVVEKLSPADQKEFIQVRLTVFFFFSLSLPAA